MDNPPPLESDTLPPSAVNIAQPPVVNIAQPSAGNLSQRSVENVPQPLTGITAPPSAGNLTQPLQSPIPELSVSEDFPPSGYYVPHVQVQTPSIEHSDYIHSPGSHSPLPSSDHQHTQDPSYVGASISPTSVVLQHPAAMPVIVVLFGEFPVAMTCPSCRAQIVTGLHHEASGLAWLLCTIMFITGLWLCCFIPFCVDAFRTVFHTCPNCRAQLGVYKRF